MLSSCITATIPKAVDTKAYCRYTASSVPQVPGRFFVFPPLLADPTGKPKENLTPVFDHSGEISDWTSSSPESLEMRSSVTNHLRKRGYTVVNFSEFVDMQEPHSIVAISLFYTDTIDVDKKSSNEPDKMLMTMIRAKSFDLDLNPASARSVSDVDGATFFFSQSTPKEIESKSFKALLEWIGDNVSGYSNI